MNDSTPPKSISKLSSKVQRMIDDFERLCHADEPPTLTKATVKTYFVPVDHPTNPHIKNDEVQNERIAEGQLSVNQSSNEISESSKVTPHAGGGTSTPTGSGNYPRLAKEAQIIPTNYESRLPIAQAGKSSPESPGIVEDIIDAVTANPIGSPLVQHTTGCTSACVNGAHHLFTPAEVGEFFISSPPVISAHSTVFDNVVQENDHLGPSCEVSKSVVGIPDEVRHGIGFRELKSKVVQRWNVMNEPRRWELPVGYLFEGE